MELWCGDDSWFDDWDWLRHPEHWSETREFIAAERRYTNSLLRDLSVHRLDVLDQRDTRPESPVWLHRGGWEYRWASSGSGRALVRRSLEGGRERPVFYPEVYAKNAGFRVNDVSIDPTGRFAAVLFDRDGSETLSYRLRDLDRNIDLGVEVAEVLDLMWCDQPRLLARVQRADRGVVIRLTTIGEDRAADAGEVQLDAEGMRAIRTTRSSDGGRALVITSFAEGDAIHILHTDGEVALQCALRASEGYRVDRTGTPPGVHGAHLYALVSSDAQRCGAVIRTELAGRETWSWETWSMPTGDVVFESLHILERALVLTERADLARRLRIMEGDDPTGRLIEPDQTPTHEVSLVGDPPYDAKVVDCCHTSLIDPPRIHAVELAGPTSSISDVRTSRILGYDTRDYVVERRWASAPDGCAIPMSIARHRDVPDDGTAPAVLFGYGAYGTVDSTANTDLHRALLKNGAVCAVAHVRGGGELGPWWHEAACGTAKGVSIDDYLACAHDLLNHGVAASGRLAAWGGSAGGLLVCGAMAREPQLFGAVVAMVPFVDVLTDLVCSHEQRHEFGDPYESPEALAAIRAYCPYQNLQPDIYPAVFVSAALNDVRVRYWHALKWVAKLRAVRTDSRRTILLMSNQGGHLAAGSSAVRHGNAVSAALGFVARELDI